MTYKKSTLAIIALATLPLLPYFSNSSNFPEITQDMVEESFDISLKEGMARQLTPTAKKDLISLLQETANSCAELVSIRRQTEITEDMPATKSYLNSVHLKKCFAKEVRYTVTGHGFPDVLHKNDFGQHLAETTVMKQIEQSKFLSSREKPRIKEALAKDHDGYRLPDQMIDLCSIFLDSQCEEKRDALSARAGQEIRKRFNILPTANMKI